MAKIELKPEEALVLVHFLMRFRDKEVLVTEHPAEEHILGIYALFLNRKFRNYSTQIIKRN